MTSFQYFHCRFNQKVLQVLVEFSAVAPSRCLSFCRPLNFPNIILESVRVLVHCLLKEPIGNDGKTSCYSDFFGCPIVNYFPVIKSDKHLGSWSLRIRPLFRFYTGCFCHCFTNFNFLTSSGAISFCASRDGDGRSQLHIRFPTGHSRAAACGF